MKQIIIIMILFICSTCCFAETPPTAAERAQFRLENKDQIKQWVKEFKELNKEIVEIEAKIAEYEAQKKIDLILVLTPDDKYKLSDGYYNFDKIGKKDLVDVNPNNIKGFLFNGQLFVLDTSFVLKQSIGYEAMK